MPFSESASERIINNLVAANADVLRRYPGDSARRQPAHVVYGGAHLFKSDTAPKLGVIALEVFTRHAPDGETLAAVTGMAPELAPTVRVNAIEVGGVETGALEHVLTDDSVRRQLEEGTPMQRIGQPEDIAAAVLYLASDAASWVTGKIFEVDGGVESPAFTIPFTPFGGSTT